MLKWRLTLGTLFIAALVALFALDARASTPGIWLFPLALLLALAGTEELLGLFQARGYRPVAAIVYAGNLIIVAVNYLPVLCPSALLGLTWPMTMFALALVAAFVGEMIRYRAPGAVIEPLGLSVFALAYIGVLLSFVVQMRLLGPDGSYGIAALASLVLVVKMTDTGAYTVGRLIGRHKLAPTLSPGKTIEGTAGGLAFALVAAWFSEFVLTPKLIGSHGPGHGWGWLAYGILVGIAGILGDLAESLIKRDVSRKDSSRWMPGFGGVLDLLDSILIAAPVAYLCWVCRLLGP